MSEQHRAKKSKKNRKHGRNNISCLVYRNTKRRERNKLVRLRKHLTRLPGDACAKAAVDRVKLVLGMK
jgi:hypothetical protein